MIITCKRRIPLLWIAFAMLPWAAVVFKVQVMGAAFIFSLKKFVENPAALTSILSFPGFLSLLLAPLSSFLSDRLWTRFGRRKPFIAFSWSIIACGLILMPLMPSFWSLVAVYVVYMVANDLGQPMEALNQEIVPPPQRGRAMAGMQWCSNFACLLFYFIVFGRFDDVSFMAGVPFSGETAIYWSAGSMMIIMLMLLALGIKEINFSHASSGERLSVGGFFRGVFDRELWPVYSLAFGAAILSSGLGALSNLLYTDQFGYSKQEMGINVAVGTTFNLCLILFLGVIADRLPKMRTYQCLIIAALAIKVVYFCYVEFVLADGRPSLVEIIIFGEMMSVVSILTSMVYMPLAYEYVPRDQMGAYGAGSGLVLRLTQLITLNGIGLFIWGYAVLFLPPAGEMARIVLREDSTKVEVQSVIENASWARPPDQAAAFPPQTWAWYATGQRLDHGRCWAIQQRDPEAQKLAEEKSTLAAQQSLLLVEQASLTKAHGSSDAKAVELKSRIAEQAAKIAENERRLSDRAKSLQSELKQIFGNRMLASGEELRDAKIQPAVVLEFSIPFRPIPSRLETVLDGLRKRISSTIDLRPVQLASGYGVTLSALLPSGEQKSAFADTLRVAFEASAKSAYPELLLPKKTSFRSYEQPALVLDLLTIEEPLDLNASPIGRGVNFILNCLGGRAPATNHRLQAMARNLRVAGQIDHVRVERGDAGDNTISVVALLSSQAPLLTFGDGVQDRLKELLGRDSTVVFQARAFYDQVTKAAALQQLTIAQPVLSAGYMPLKYDYMSGYIWMFLLGLGGLAVTFLFARREKKGLIRKRGIEEAQRTIDSSFLDDFSAGSRSPIEFETYTPGYARAKLVMAIVGFIIIGVGLCRLWEPLRLMAFGTWATAEATRIVQSKAGQPDLQFADDISVQSATAAHDRSYLFSNEFQFHTSSGQVVDIACPIRSRLKPLYSLVDPDGLPTRLPVCYDASRPQATVFPSILGTWFFDGMIVFLGGLCCLIGLVLFYWAKKPIEIPRVSAPSKPPAFVPM